MEKDGTFAVFDDWTGEYIIIWVVDFNISHDDEYIIIAEK